MKFDKGKLAFYLSFFTSLVVIFVVSVFVVSPELFFKKPKNQWSEDRTNIELMGLGMMIAQDERLSMEGRYDIRYSVQQPQYSVLSEAEILELVVSRRPDGTLGRHLEATVDDETIKVELAHSRGWGER